MSYTVVIPSKNVENLVQCVVALRHFHERGPVVVLDDGLKVRPHWPNVEYVEGVQPFIYARNVNRGIAAARGDIVVMGDDVLLGTDRGFETLAIDLEEHPGLGVVSAGTNCVGNPDQQWEPELGFQAVPNPLAFVCVMIRRECLEQVGPLDERFDGYGFEDDDFCRRAILKGWEMAVDHRVYVDHKTLPSEFRSKPGHNLQMIHNRELYEEKWRNISAK